MVNKIKNKYPYHSIEKTFTIAGVILIILSIIATIFGIWVSQRFIYEPLDVVYYSRYLLILCGGYLIGHIVSVNSKSKKSGSILMFEGVLYSLFTYLAFLSIDVMRVLVRNLFGYLPYPWEKILFEGSPLIALFIAAIVAVILNSHKYAKKSGNTFKWLFMLLFMIQQIGSGVHILSISILPQLSFELLWTVLLAMTTPLLIVAIIAYFCIGNVKEYFNRMFFASIIATIYGATYLMIWEFSTNPMVEAIEIFDSIAIILVLVLMSVLIWCVRKSIRK